jgi:hypothetical protein
VPTSTTAWQLCVANCSACHGPAGGGAVGGGFGPGAHRGRPDHRRRGGDHRPRPDAGLPFAPGAQRHRRLCPVPAQRRTPAARPPGGGAGDRGLHRRRRAARPALVARWLPCAGRAPWPERRRPTIPRPAGSSVRSGLPSSSPRSPASRCSATSTGPDPARAVLLAICLGGIGIGIPPGRTGCSPAPNMSSPSLPGEPGRHGWRFDDETASITRRTFLIRSLVAAFAGLGAALAVGAVAGPAPGGPCSDRGRRAAAWWVSTASLSASTAAGRRRPRCSRKGRRLGGCPDPPDRVADGLPCRPTAGLGAAGLRCVLEAVYHAGCPVGLYRAAEHKLICPCHHRRSTSSMATTPTFSPAARHSPAADPAGADGTFVGGRLPEPVGPASGT